MLGFRLGFRGILGESIAISCFFKKHLDDCAGPSFWACAKIRFYLINLINKNLYGAG